MVRRLVALRMWRGRFNPYGPYNRFARVIWHKRISRTVRDLASPARRPIAQLFWGQLVHLRSRSLANAVGAALLLTTLCGAPVGAEEETNPLRHTDAEPTAWQGATLVAQ